MGTHDLRADARATLTAAGLPADGLEASSGPMPWQTLRLGASEWDGQLSLTVRNGMAVHELPVASTERALLLADALETMSKALRALAAELPAAAEED